MTTTQRKLKHSGTEKWLQSLKSTNMGPRKSAVVKSHTGDFNGLVQQAWENRPKSGNALHSSIPNNLNQVGYSDKPELNGKNKGPTYKSPEEYYDEILVLKKQIGVVQSENENLKSRYRRLEQDATKKEKQIANIMDPNKDSELRRTLADNKSSNSSAVVQSLKQKVFRLEVQLREKENENSKLLSDIKMTKTEELKTQYEVLYNELLRLRESLALAKSAAMQHAMISTAPPTPRSARSTGKPPLAFSRSASNLSGEQAGMQKSMRRLAEEKTRLEAENQKLRSDLSRALESNSNNNALSPQNRSTTNLRALPNDYEDMNQKELLREIEILNMKLSQSNGEEKNKQIVELQKEIIEYNRVNNAQTIELESLKRIVHLQQTTETKLKSNYELKCQEVKELEEAIIVLKQESKNSGWNNSSPALPPENNLKPRQPRRKVNRNNEQAVKPIAGPSQAEIDDFKRNHAAKVIQRNWASHQDDSNMSLIQSAIKGHNSREESLNNSQRSH